MSTKKKILFLFVILIGVGIAVVIAVIVINTGDTYGDVVSLSPVRVAREREAFVSFLAGQVFVYREDIWQFVEIGDHVQEDDYIKVFENSYCELQMGNSSVILIEEDTIIKVKEIIYANDKRTGVLEILIGTLLCKVEKMTSNEKFEIQSSHTAFGVRGTEFLINRGDVDTILAVQKGRVAVIWLETGLDKLIVTDHKQVSVQNVTGEIGILSAFSAESIAQLEKIKKLMIMSLEKKYESELVKLALRVVPVDAEIYLNGELVAYGFFAGIYGAGSSLSFIIKRNGYKDQNFDVKVERGKHYEYRLKLEIDDPEYSVSARRAEEGQESLKQELIQLKSENKELESVIADLQSQITTLDSQKSDLNTQVQSLQVEKASLEQNLERALVELEIYRDVFGDALDEVKKRLEGLDNNN